MTGVQGENTLDIHFKGEGEDETVEGPDFVDFLSNTLAILRKLELARAPGEKSQINYRIVGLELGSATITFAQATRPEARAIGLAVLRDYADGVEALQDRTISFLGFDPEIQRHFERLAKPLRRGLKAVEIQTVDKSVRLRSEAFEEVAIEAPIENATLGSFSGFIDAVNVHKEPLFYLYPIVGPARIRCVFDSLMMEDVRSALKKYTTVHGLMESYAGSPFPARIVVERIEVNPPDTDLPTLASLWGIDPQLTGGIESTVYVRQMRDAGE